MAILPITLYGDKILRKKVNRVDEVDMKTIEIIRDMFETMKNANGVGLAANQVGADKSIFILDLSGIEGYESQKPMVLINPEILEKSEETVFIEEGCLSIPDIRAEVERPESIKIKFYDTNMNEQIIEADEFLARVMQHEYDHLQGILFTDLVPEPVQKKLKRDIFKIKNRKIEFEYPVSERFDYQLQQ